MRVSAAVSIDVASTSILHRLNIAVGNGLRKSSGKQLVSPSGQDPGTLEDVEQVRAGTGIFWTKKLRLASRSIGTVTSDSKSSGGRVATKGASGQETTGGQQRHDQPL